MNRSLQTCLLFACLLCGAELSKELHPNDYTGGRSRDVTASAERNTSSVAAMLGGFRTALSDIMYIKTELYLHSGVAYEPHLDDETLATVGAIKEIDEHAPSSATGKPSVEEHAHGHDHGAPDTIIPTEKKDWRGFIGHLHRKVKPWRDPTEPHVLTDGREMLPWFRVMTMTDPHYVRGYAVGAWWLKKRNLEAAIAFAREGITNNPSSFEIHYTLGELLMERGRKANNGSNMNPGPEALKDFLAARDIFQTGAEFAIAQRPRGWVDDPAKESPEWSKPQEDDCIGITHMAVLTERNYGDPAKAAALAKHFIETFRSDTVFQSVIDTTAPK